MANSITICIPTCLGNVDFFIQLLISISEQSVLPDETLIIVNGDNRSKKMHQNLIDKIRNLLPSNINPNFIISEKAGLSRARNIGIEKCKTDILIFGDDDDIWHKDKIYLIHKIIKENGICLVRHRFNLLIENKIKNASRKYNYNPNLFLIGITNLVGGGSTINGSTCIFKTLKFNENYKSCEDWDFWIRASLANIPILNCDKILVTYRVHKDRMTKKYLKMLIFESAVRYKYLFRSLIIISGLIIGFLKSFIKYLLIDIILAAIINLNKNLPKF